VQGLLKKKSFADSYGRTVKAVEDGLRGIHSIDTPALESVSPTLSTNFSGFSSWMICNLGFRFTR
jgi:hypothetical protein